MGNRPGVIFIILVGIMESLQTQLMDQRLEEQSLGVVDILLKDCQRVTSLEAFIELLHTSMAQEQMEVNGKQQTGCMTQVKTMAIQF